MIDWQRVEGLRSEVGPEDFREVVALFLEEVDEVVSRLSTRPDPTLYEQDLHFLKGSALNLGFRQLALMCQTGENEAAAGRAAAVDVGDILSCYRASLHAFMTRSETFGIAPLSDNDTAYAVGSGGSTFF